MHQAVFTAAMDCQSARLPDHWGKVIIHGLFRFRLYYRKFQQVQQQAARSPAACAAALVPFSSFCHVFSNGIASDGNVKATHGVLFPGRLKVW